MCAGANTDKKAQSLDQRECLDHLATEGQQVKLAPPWLQLDCHPATG